MKKTQEEIERLKTLQESYSDLSDKVIPISDLALEVQKGKEDIVNAIVKKGGTSSTSKTLGQIAKDVSLIDNITKEVTSINSYDFILPGVVSILERFHSAYNNNYPTMQGGTTYAYSVITISDRPDALITSEGVIESPSGDYVIPPSKENMSIGWFIIAYKDRAIVAINHNCYYYNYGAYNADITFPDSCFESAKVVMVELEDCHITCNKRTFYGSTLTHFTMINSELKPTNLESVFYNARLCSFTEHKEHIYHNGTIGFNSNVIYNLPITKKISASQFALAQYGGGVQTVIAPELEEIEGLRITDGYSGKTLYLPKLKKVTGDLISSPSILYCITPELVTFPTSSSSSFVSTAATSLIGLTIGKDINFSIVLNTWRPSYTKDDKKVIELNKNLRETFIGCLADRTEQEPLTITFYQTLRDVLEEETENAFYAKNWNIAPTKSV